MSVGARQPPDDRSQDIIRCLKDHKAPALSKRDLMGAMKINYHELDRQLYQLVEADRVEVHDTGYALIFYLSESESELEEPN
jgi:hypothetical protein